MAIKSSNQITFTEHKKIIEIKEWYLATPSESGITVETEGWTTDIQTINSANKYLWNYEEVVYSIGPSDVSEPVIIGFYGKGESGRGILSITNYYQVSESPVMPDLNVDWLTYVPLLTPTNKYLWNYEVIVYTDETETYTDPAIIGVYGDSGENAITFEIYSPKGFIFKEDLKQIELRVAAFDGGESILGAKYTWAWWDDNTEAYSVIVEDTEATTLVVNDADVYAFAGLKCTMTYNGKTYDDFVSLSSETVIYTSIVKFFDGSNILNADDIYIVAYIDLYQNNHKVETVSAHSYCSGLSTISSGGVISSSVTGDFYDGDRMYFVYVDDDGVYRSVLGEYTSGVWNVITVNTQYDYENTLYPDIRSNVIVVPKESINKALNIDFTIYKDGTYVSSTNAMIIDSNDPIVSSTPPENPVYNQLWLDTSVTPCVLKIFTKIDGMDSGRWVECAERLGGNVYTNKPTVYMSGDLWILADGETCGDFGPGSMLKAIATISNPDDFNELHWIDADTEMTELKANIKNYFVFDPDTGLKIGQTDEKFYVNISSTEMGFYDNSAGQNQKVVNISNNSATIQSARLKGNTDFYGQINICDPTSDPDDTTSDALFIFKIEPSNGSLSLVVAT